MKPKILFYDIETAPLQAWVWRCGKQVVRHNQLVEGYSRYKVICITYCWENGPVKALMWDYETQDQTKMLKEFDKLIQEADITIGKNSDRFDVKQLNAQRLFHDHDGMSDWSIYTEDLETQLRKHFYLPSYSLDYISKELGYGGKTKMEFEDWIDIVTRHPKRGKQKLKKMVNYGKKDTRDTRSIWKYCLKHFTPKFNYATFDGERCCVVCGSKNIICNGKRIKGKTLYQRYLCKDHKGAAGKAPISKTGIIGKMGI